MSATIKYKGNTIATITTDSSKTLKTSGKYCEGDIVVENVQDGGGGGGHNPCNLLGYTLGAPGGKNYTGFVHWWNTSAAFFTILGDLYTKKIRLVASSTILENNTSEIKQENVLGIVGHKYYFQGQIKTTKITGNSASPAGGYILTAFYDALNNSYHGTTDQLYPSIANEWVTYHRIVECTHERNYFRMLLGIENCNSGDTAEFRNLILFDLTEMFGSGSEPSDEWCFAEYGNLNVDSSYPKEVGKCSYNGTVLPALPTETLAEYPYAWIRYNSQTGYYDLLLSETVWWWSDATTMSRAEGTTKWFRVPINNAVFGIWEANEDNTSTEWGNGETQRYIIWANHDIPKGSATATEIYFEGSEPVPAE